MSTSPARYRNQVAAACIAVIAVLPLAALLLPSPLPVSADASPGQRLIVLLPADAGDLPQAAAVLDSAQARPLGQGAWPNLWLVSAAAPDATTRLYDAGAWLVLAGDGLLAGCFSFRPLSPA